MIVLKKLCHFLQQALKRIFHELLKLTREQNAPANIYGYNGKYNISQHLLGLTAAYRF